MTPFARAETEWQTVRPDDFETTDQILAERDLRKTFRYPHELSLDGRFYTVLCRCLCGQEFHGYFCETRGRIHSVESGHSTNERLRIPVEQHGPLKARQWDSDDDLREYDDLKGAGAVPGLDRCVKCSLSLDNVKGHALDTADGHSITALCVWCWHESTPADRFATYRDKWRPTYPSGSEMDRYLSSLFEVIK